MRTLDYAAHFDRLSIQAHGELVSERHASMAYRWRTFGVHPLCGSCVRRGCKDKAAGAVGVTAFVCEDYLGKTKVF